jgi:phosphoribosylanthranilate isomerase
VSFITKIKFSCITNLSDARFAAAAGADYLGFCFDAKSEAYIPTVKAKEIIGWVTGSRIVATFGEQPLDEIAMISDLLEVEVVEVHNNIRPGELVTIGKPLIKKIDLGGMEPEAVTKEIDAYKACADAFHFFSSGPCKVPDAQLLDLCSQHKVIWGLRLDPSTVRDTVMRFKPYAIDIQGGQEEHAGIRDFDELHALLEALEES